MISHWLAAFGSPGIIVVGKDMRFTGWGFQDFRTPRNIGLQTVIPGNHQSSGADERRRGLYRIAIDRIFGNKNENA